MANELVLRNNFVGGLVEDNPLIASGTSFTSAALAALGVVDATNHATLIFDPDGVAGPPEIIWVVVHTAAATTATIQRAQESTSARNHNIDTPWIHAPTAADYTNTQNADRAWLRTGAISPLDDEFRSNALNASWVRYDTVANIVTYTVGGDVINANHIGSTSDNAGPAHCLLKPIGAMSYPLTVEVSVRMMRQYATNYQMVGPIITDGTAASNKAIWVMPYGNTTIATANTFNTRTFAALNGTQTTVYGGVNWEIIGGQVYMRLRWSAANTFQSEWSCDGVGWYRLPAADMSWTMTPTHVGFAISSWQSANPCMASIEYLRVS